MGGGYPGASPGMPSASGPYSGFGMPSNNAPGAPPGAGGYPGGNNYPSQPQFNMPGAPPSGGNYPGMPPTNVNLGGPMGQPFNVPPAASPENPNCVSNMIGPGSSGQAPPPAFNQVPPPAFNQVPPPAFNQGPPSGSNQGPPSGSNQIPPPPKATPPPGSMFSNIDADLAYPSINQPSESVMKLPGPPSAPGQPPLVPGYPPQAPAPYAQPPAGADIKLSEIDDFEARLANLKE